MRREVAAIWKRNANIDHGGGAVPLGAGTGGGAVLELSVAICDATTAIMTINASASAIRRRLLRMFPRLGLGIALPVPFGGACSVCV
jgi:hypothetical protein